MFCERFSNLPIFLFFLTAGDVISEGEQRVMIGAASRGIIQKEYQHDAKIYKTAYEKNPFDKVNAEELDEYTQQFGVGPRTDLDTSGATYASTMNDSMQHEDAISPDGSYSSAFFTFCSLFHVDVFDCKASCLTLVDSMFALLFFFLFYVFAHSKACINLPIASKDPTLPDSPLKVHLIFPSLFARFIFVLFRS